MADPTLDHRLAAILAADVAGYSALMQDDERATLVSLDECRGVFREQAGQHGGRVVDTAGDSVLAVFPSAIGAVRAATQIQAALACRNEALPETRRMRFRIGVNLGDVMEKDDGSVYGDGVNIAARIESLTQPGGVSVSGSVHDSVEGKLELAFDATGSHEVKNIARPVRVYRVVTAASTGSVATPADKPSVAVLPFDNMSRDPEQEYFADGISEDIITDLSKVSGLFVIARNSSFAYKGKSPKIPQVSRELGARFVLEGSVRKAGNRVRINAQLIDGHSGGHVWAERFDRDLTDIFAVQDEVTERIVKVLEVTLTEKEQQIIAHRGTEDLEAYDLYLRGRDQIMHLNRESNLAGRRLLEQAMARDPGFAAPLAMIAMARLGDFVNRWGEEFEDGLRDGRERAERAVAIDALEPHAHLALALALLWSREHDAAVVAAERALALDPNFALAHGTLGMILHYAGDSGRALASIATGQRLNPHQIDLGLHNQALCHFMLEDYETAGDLLRQRIERAPRTDISRALLASARGHQGRLDEARSVWAELAEVNPEYSLQRRGEILPYRNPQDFQRIVEGVRKAGIEVS